MIPVKNIYYMLAYAFHFLRENGYQKIGREDFEDVNELFAAILIQGITLQVKRGLGREYIEETAPCSPLKGKIDLPQTFRSKSLIKKKIVCTYDEFSVNTRMNQILKSVSLLLIRSGISLERQKRMRFLLMYFANVEEIDLRKVDWRFSFSRVNQSYRFLMVICRLLCCGQLQGTSSDALRLMDFRDSRELSALYENFLLSYYRRHFPQLHANASYIDWYLTDACSYDLLPSMKTDITLTDGEKTLIIDAKYYESGILQTQFEKKSVRSGHLYQIFAYVKNKAATMNNPQNVSGMLLYAKTNEEMLPNNEYSMSGNKIAVRTLDLGGDFSTIREQLDGIIATYFPAAIRSVNDKS